MFNTQPEAFDSEIAAQRRCEFVLAARHAGLVRILERERRRARENQPAPRAPKPQCGADIG